jgi:formylmethanofuran dehydrogenase subunit B
MLKQIIVTLDTSDPLQAQLLVEYLASNDRVRFGRCCMLLGYLAGTQPHPSEKGSELPEQAQSEIATSTLAPKIGLTLEDLGIETSDTDKSSVETAIKMTEPIESQLMQATSSSHSVAQSNDSMEEVKTATKPKIGGGLFGLD